MGRLAGTVARACLAAGIALMAAALARAEPAAAADLSTEQIEKILRDYLMREPEVVLQALQEMQRREAEASAARQRAAIAKNQNKLLEDPLTPVGGNPDGDVTLVEFFDYHCAYCRRVVSSVRELLDEDSGLRVVFKDMPVLGPDSVRAARAALASRKQDGYVPFHFALMATDDLSLAGIRATAKAVGLDPDRLEADMDAPEVNAVIEANYALAHELGIEGTPAFVIGDQLIPGAIEKARLEHLIDEARSG
jgi:protein-disulfide isomerase